MPKMWTRVQNADQLVAFYTDQHVPEHARRELTGFPLLVRWTGRAVIAERPLVDNRTDPRRSSRRYARRCHRQYVKNALRDGSRPLSFKKWRISELAPERAQLVFRPNGRLREHVLGARR